MTISGSLDDIFGITKRRELTEEELKPIAIGTLVKLKPGVLNEWAFGGEMRKNEEKIRGLILKKTSRRARLLSSVERWYFTSVRV